MTPEQYETLVKDLEVYARRQPAGYCIRVGLLAALGYVYIFLVLALVVALIGVVLVALAQLQVGWLQSVGRVVARGIGWPLIALAILILRAYWVRFPKPGGLELRRKEVPRLFDMVDELTSALRAPRFHHLLLTSDFNAAVAQIPRLGLLGWQRNYLLLGLPLMQALSPQQFRAIVAHELGHLCGNHSRFGGWIYRVRQTWDQLLERLRKERHLGSFVFEPFFDWYAPFFSAYSFVLRRANEYVADRCAAELAGAQNAAEALIQCRIRAHSLGKSFWPSVYEQIGQRPEPPAAVFATMARTLRGDLSAEDVTQSLQEVLAFDALFADTHPPLRDRVAALGYPLAPDGSTVTGRSDQPLPAPAEEAAAEHLLGAAAERLTARLEHDWWVAEAPLWRERFARVHDAQTRLRTLDAKAQSQELTVEEAWDRAQLTAELRGNEAALPGVQDVLATQPDHPGANYALGRALLLQDDAAGIGHLEKAMKGEPDLTVAGCQLVYFFLKRHGQDAEAARYGERAANYAELGRRAAAERAVLRAQDTLLPHHLSVAEIERLRQQLSRHEQVGTAYLVRKAVAYCPERPVHVLAVKPRRPWLRLSTDKKENQELVEQLKPVPSSLEFLGTTFVAILQSESLGAGRTEDDLRAEDLGASSVVVLSNDSELARALRQVTGAEVYRRGKRQ